MTPFEVPALRDLQRRFLDITTRPALVTARTATRPALPEPAIVESWLKSTPTESVFDRLAIYHDGYFARLTECLADDYPALRACLGQPEFDELCRQYIAAHPSRRPNLNHFGERLPEFVAHCDHESRRFLGELAQLEWALVECVHADAGEGRLLEDLQSVDFEGLARVRFVSSPSLRLFEFAFPTNRILQAYFDDQPPEIPALEATHVAVARRATQVWRVDLDGDAFGLLSRLADGQPLEEALGATAATPEALRASFATWAECGVLIGVAA